MPELIVHHLPDAWGLPSVSPFCLKLDTYLRIVDLPFEVVIDKVPFGAPKKKLPYIEHQGRRIGLRPAGEYPVGAHCLADQG